MADDDLTRLSTAGPWYGVLRGPERARLEAALPRWLARQRWYGGKARRVEAVRIVDDVPVADAPEAPRIALLRVEYAGGAAEHYALPLAFARGEAGVAGDGALAELGGPRARGRLHAADRDPAFARAALEAIAAGRRLPGGAGELVGWPSSALGPAVPDPADPALEPAPLGTEQSNTSVRFGRRLVLKLFRRAEPGPNPELEVGAYLTEVARYAWTPPVMGGLEYRPRAGEPVALAVLQAYVANEGDAWRFMLGEVDAALARASGLGPPQPSRARVEELAESDPPSELR